MGNATSDASSSLVFVGRPGKVGKPVVQNGQTRFSVSFNPGEGRCALQCTIVPVLPFTGLHC